MLSLTWHHSLLCLFMGWLCAVPRLPLDSWVSPLASLLTAGIRAIATIPDFGHHSCLWDGGKLYYQSLASGDSQLLDWGSQLLYLHLTESFQTLEENSVPSCLSLPGLPWCGPRFLHSISRHENVNESRPLGGDHSFSHSPEDWSIWLLWGREGEMPKAVPLGTKSIT